MVSKVTWRKARHPRTEEYVLKFNHPELYARMSKAIAEKGYDGYFFRTKWRYLDIGGYKYWVDEPVLNRERLKQTKLR